MGIYGRHVPDRIITALIAMLLILFIFIGTVSAEDSSIIGTVTDKMTGEPIANAAVTVGRSDLIRCIKCFRL